MSEYDKASEMFERSMDEVYDNIGSIQSILEELSVELSDADMCGNDWRKLDLLVSRAMNRLDEI